LLGLLKQLSGYPKALGMSDAVMLFTTLLPGIPKIPFLALGTGASALAFIIDKRAKLTAAAEEKKTEPQPRQTAQTSRLQPCSRWTI
jgi:flagellar biosynthesis protein FlhA